MAKSSLGGFTISSKPIVKPADEKVVEKDVKQVTEVKPSPISGFSFGSNASATTAVGAVASVVATPALGIGSSLSAGSKSESVKISSEAAPVFEGKTCSNFRISRLKK